MRDTSVGFSRFQFSYCSFLDFLEACCWSLIPLNNIQQGPDLGPDLTELRQILAEMAGTDFLVQLISAMRDDRALCEDNFHYSILLERTSRFRMELFKNVVLRPNRPQICFEATITMTSKQPRSRRSDLKRDEGGGWPTATVSMSKVEGRTSTCCHCQGLKDRVDPTATVVSSAGYLRKVLP